jgi:tight adherence protein B
VTSVATAARSLKAQVDAGMPARAAVRTWARRCPEPLGGVLQRVAARLELGEDLSDALRAVEERWGPDATSLRIVLAVHERIGGDVAQTLEMLALALDESERSLSASRAAAATARWSARVIAALPFLLLPFIASTGAPVFDGAGTIFVVAGVLLGGGGLLWIERMMPRPPGLDDGALLAAVTAAAARGGVEASEALRVACEMPPETVARGLRRAGRLLRLGLDMSEALMRSGDDALQEIGSELSRSLAVGAPAAEVLERFARGRIAARSLEFEERMRKSAVFMILPVSLCVLPAYVLIVLVPFLRSLSS